MNGIGGGVIDFTKREIPSFLSESECSTDARGQWTALGDVSQIPCKEDRS